MDLIRADQPWKPGTWDLLAKAVFFWRMYKMDSIRAGQPWKPGTWDLLAKAVLWNHLQNGFNKGGPAMKTWNLGFASKSCFFWRIYILDLEWFGFTHGWARPENLEPGIGLQKLFVWRIYIMDSYGFHMFEGCTDMYGIYNNIQYMNGICLSYIFVSWV